eukprot:gene11180-20121_t
MPELSKPFHFANRRKEQWNRRRACTKTITKRSGKCNGNADALSRCPITSSLEGTQSCIKSWDVAVLDAVDVSGLQDEDQEMKEMKDYYSNGRFQINDDLRKKIDSFSANYFLEDDVLYHRWTPKIY